MSTILFPSNPGFFQLHQLLPATHCYAKMRQENTLIILPRAIEFGHIPWGRCTDHNNDMSFLFAKSEEMTCCYPPPPKKKLKMICKLQRSAKMTEIHELFCLFARMEADGDCKGRLLACPRIAFPWMSRPTTSRNEITSPKPLCIFISFGKDNKKLGELHNFTNLFFCCGWRRQFKGGFSHQNSQRILNLYL